MLWKIYFFGIGLVILFSAYYQWVITADFKLLDTVNLISELVLLLGAYSYIFKKSILDPKKWYLIYKGLIGLIVINIIYQVWPTNYYGNFSFLSATLLTNIFAYLVVLCFFIPLYYTVYQLAKKFKKKG